MSNICYNGVTVAPLIQAPCGGIYTSSACIVHAPTLSYLNLPAGSTQEQINTSLINALIAKDQTIAALTARIVILEL